MADALNEVEDDETMTESQEYGGDESTKLSDTDKKKLIEALKHHPCLWDSTVPQDKQKKLDSSRELAANFKLSVEELKKVFHSLRTSMVREVKRGLKDKKYVSKWKFYKSLEFLKGEIIKGLTPVSQQPMWSDSEIETIIEYYKENSFLWNHHLSDYKDRDKREVVLAKLADQLSHTVQEIKGQWHTLKSSFDREYNRMEASKRSGSGTDSVYFPSWKFFRSLIFTRECRSLDDSTSTLSGVSTSPSPSDSVEKEQSQPPLGSIKRSFKKKKAAKSEDTRIELWREAIDVLKGNENNINNPVDPETKELISFGKMVEETLTRFNKRQRAVAKKRIGDVLFEVEMEEVSVPPARGNRPCFQQQQQQQQYWGTAPSHLSRFATYQGQAGRSPSPAPSVSSYSDSSAGGFGESYLPENNSYLASIQDLG